MNNNNSEIYKNLKLHKLFENQVKKTPKSICISCGKRELTYQEFNHEANRIAHYLNVNVPFASRIAVCLERSIESVAVLVGILKSGKAYIPLDPSSPLEQNYFILKNSGAQLVILQDKFVNLFQNMEVDILDLQNLVGEIDQKNIDNLDGAKLSNLAAILYTSGTTSKSKGVCLTHQGLVNRIEWMRKVFSVGEQDRILNKTSICFDISIWEIFLPLISGGTLICAGGDIPRSSEELVDFIKKQKVTIIHFVPQMLKCFLETKGVKECQSLRHVFVSGDVLHMQKQKIFFKNLNCDLHNLYGPTEASIDVTHWHCKKNSGLDFVPIGKPIDNVLLYILDKDLNKVKEGQVGEIYLGGICLAQGYIDKSLDSKYFIMHSDLGYLYKTGDFAEYMLDGNIKFIGRKDRQIKLGGYRVELSTAEELISTYPKINSVAVYYSENEPGFKQTIAYIVINHEQPEKYVVELENYLKTKIPFYMVPMFFAVVKKIPLTERFKVDYVRLPQLKDLKKISNNLYQEI